jgi:tetratricopeptide (TPR) repeat protein
MAVTLVGLKFGAGLSWWLSILVSVLIALGVFVAVARYVLKKVTEVVEGAVKDLQAQRFEKGIRELKAALKYGKWQFYVTGQLNSQIGMVYYMKRDFSNAFPYLEKSFFKNWVAMGMLGVTYLKRNKKDKMIQTFENTVRWTGKESLLWALYAYCLAEAGDKGKAVEVLQRGLKKLPGDEKLTQNLEFLNEGKKMKMKPYGEMWLQFHLESIGTIQKQQMAAMGGSKRRIIRR